MASSGESAESGCASIVSLIIFNVQLSNVQAEANLSKTRAT